LIHGVGWFKSINFFTSSKEGMSSDELADKPADKLVNKRSNKNDIPWITISMLGTTLGTAVAGATFVATHTSSKALASTTGLTLSLLGEVASMGASVLFGNIVGVSVRVLSKTVAATTEQAMNQTGYVTAGVLAAVAGATTALSVSVGSRVINYTIEHGGKISKEVAEKISETYLRYRATHGDLEDIQDWVEIEEENEETIMSAVRKLEPYVEKTELEPDSNAATEDTEMPTDSNPEDTEMPAEAEAATSP
jgi:hypothetical protein